MCNFQNTEKSKDWYKTMFKQIHKIPGRFVHAHRCSVGLFCLSYMSFCHHLHVTSNCAVSPSLCSESIEENPYHPTYIFPESYDIQVKPKGIRRHPLPSLASLIWTFLRLLNCASLRPTCLIMSKVFQMFSIHPLSCLFCISGVLF